MKAVVQKVLSAGVTVDGERVAAIGRGLFVLVGLAEGDGSSNVEALVHKVTHLRIFEDADGKMNLSVRDIPGEILVVSEFTLCGDARRGHRPSYSSAMSVEEARIFWPVVEAAFRNCGVQCAFGRFQAMMACDLINEGPVTILLET